MIILGYKSSFLDNEIYGAEDVSRIFSHLVSNGTIAYPEDATLVEALDEMTSEITSEGVGRYDGLKVTKTDTGIKIGQGVGFFKSGVCVEVDVEGAELEIVSDVAVYIYFIHETEFNRVRLAVSELPPEGDVLVLAQLLANGNIIDMRVLAQSKIVQPTANFYYDLEITHSRFGEYEDRYSSNTTYFQMPHGGFRYLILHDIDVNNVEIDLCSEVIDLTAEGEQEIKLTRDTIPAYLKVLRTGNELRIATVRLNIKDEVHTLYMTLV